MKIILKLLFSCFAGAILLIGSLALPVKIDDYHEMQQYIKHGFPLTYVLQDISAYDPPPDAFPLYYPLASPWENPVKILWGPFFLGWFLYTLLIFFLPQIFKGVKKLGRGRPHV